MYSIKGKEKEKKGIRNFKVVTKVHSAEEPWKQYINNKQNLAVRSEGLESVNVN